MRNHFPFVIIAMITGAVAAAHAQSLIVVNQGNATVTIVDPTSFTVTGRIDERQSG